MIFSVTLATSGLADSLVCLYCSIITLLLRKSKEHPYSIYKFININL
jgi:hypothetical protein